MSEDQLQDKLTDIAYYFMNDERPIPNDPGEAAALARAVIRYRAAANTAAFYQTMDEIDAELATSLGVDRAVARRGG